MSSDQISSNPQILDRLSETIVPVIYQNKVLFTLNKVLNNGSEDGPILINQSVPVKAGQPILILVSFQQNGLFSTGTNQCDCNIGSITLPSQTTFMGVNAPTYAFFVFSGIPLVDNPLIYVGLSTDTYFNDSNGLASVTIIQ
jgi:hypothetical protein